MDKAEAFSRRHRQHHQRQQQQQQKLLVNDEVPKSNVPP